MNMNLPNKLTIFRAILIPFFLYFLLADTINDTTYRFIALGIFIFASATDALDGHIARRDNLVTNFGKFMDPIADKLLVSSALIAMVYLTLIGPIPVIIMIGREFVISGFRLVAVEKNVVIAASKFGKWKTATQMVMIVYMLSYVPDMNVYTEFLGIILIYVSTILALVSAVDYIAKNKSVLKD